jgi:hypothetical protein
LRQLSKNDAILPKTTAANKIQNITLETCSEKKVKNKNGL